jgi:hypothetical protein
MPTNAKIVTLPRPGENLPPELRDFLDKVIVPALTKKWLAENQPEPRATIFLEAAARPATYFEPTERKK